MIRSRIFFLCTLFCISALLCVAQQKADIHVLLQGKISDASGKGIGGVMVTDGTNCVSTDVDGNYTLQSTNQAMFVYITVPSGYEIPANNNLAKFYQKITPVHGRYQGDFLLTKMSRDDKKHYTIVWADPQINSQEQADMLHSQVVSDTRQHAKELLKKGPVTGIAAGDIAWDAPAIIPEYKKAVKNSGIPFFQVLGNHDMDIHTRSDEASDRTFKESFGPSWYSFNRGDAHYIVLDNVFYYANGYNYIGYITEKQFKWLEQDLARVKPGSLVFVSMHISAYTEDKKRSGSKQDNPGSITFNRKFLYDMLKPYQAHLLTGHTHYNENYVEDNVYEHIHASVCAAWWTSPICNDGTPGGYGVYEIDGNELKWYYKSLGREKDYQMKLYPPGSYADKPGAVVANVWNWDKDWKVEWFEDGKLMGNMQQYTGLDADAVKYMAGADKPGKYSWIEPMLTDHLFFVTPSHKAKKLKVVATDRFGEKYVQDLRLKAD
ncbi:3',5'-cyclic AMP phosphodiesterase CpdA [Arcticibacter pallidicorallinus]|uniref:3',5'-cyclic AMP phosphodiesterase CpdA n=1 Tax=Arcticibacter pallidicorallinus TaxID=1259464 RepID=A0A2T0U0N6_9SPHI|nr:calcineurin-like phosphoesterase family protein [Arcticibacter pallidicorallinus]PRY51474.1 3',5'-cyclic AMP phosphodiesterase CpdA [Arcticibacter pallidicorallinus]